MKSIFCLLVICAAAVCDEPLPESCLTSDNCVIEVPDSFCANGRPSYVKLTYRPGATNLMIYLNGGGACWDLDSCDCRNGICHGGTAETLSRPHPDTLGGWTTGPGWRNASLPKNPVGKNYNIVHMPYCTGDIYAGRKKTEYGSVAIHHVGYDSVGAVLRKVSGYFSRPQKLLFMGCSAGGLGVLYNAPQARTYFPDSSIYVLSDSGLPFKAPHVNAEKVQAIFKTWGADETLGDVDLGPDHSPDGGDMIRHLREKFSDIRYGLISGYQDLVMTFFSGLLQSPYWDVAVQKTMIDIADNDLGGTNQNVFYLNSSTHCFGGMDPAAVISENKSLADWSIEMLSDDAGWKSVRPDLY